MSERRPIRVSPFFLNYGEKIFIKKKISYPFADMREAEHFFGIVKRGVFQRNKGKNIFG